MPKTSSKISVYIPCHNYGRFVSDAIESVLRQSLNDFEVILINDGSTDNTKEIFSRYKSDPRFKIIDTVGVGLHAVCNLALQHANGKYIIRLDADDRFDEQILLVLSTYLDQHPDVAMVYSDYFLMDEFGEIYAQERSPRLYREDHVFDSAPNGACFLARTQILRNIGGYSDKLQAQDGYHIWLKLSSKYRCGNINLPLYYYRRHGDNLTRDSHRILGSRREILRQYDRGSLEKCRPIIAVIPTRTSYDFVPDVYNLQLSKSSILKLAIDSVIRSTLPDKIIITSDSNKASEVLKEFNDPRLEFFLRDRRETLRSESLLLTLSRIIKLYDPTEQGMVAVRYVQTPFLATESFEQGILALSIHDVDSTHSVTKINQQIFARTAYGLEALNPKGLLSNRTGELYFDAQSTFCLKNQLVAKGALTGRRSAKFEISEEEAFFIDTNERLEFARSIAKRYKLSLSSYETKQTQLNNQEQLQDKKKTKGRLVNGAFSN